MGSLAGCVHFQVVKQFRSVIDLNCAKPIQFLVQIVPNPDSLNLNKSGNHYWIRSGSQHK